MKHIKCDHKRHILDFGVLKWCKRCGALCYYCGTLRWHYPKIAKVKTTGLVEVLVINELDPSANGVSLMRVADLPIEIRETMTLNTWGIIDE